MPPFATDPDLQATYWVAKEFSLPVWVVEAMHPRRFLEHVAYLKWAAGEQASAAKKSSRKSSGRKLSQNAQTK